MNEATVRVRRFKRIARWIDDERQVREVHNFPHRVVIDACGGTIHMQWPIIVGMRFPIILN